MYQSRDRNWLCDKMTQFHKANYAIKKLQAEVDRAHLFLYIVNDTLQRCCGVGRFYGEEEEHDVTLLFQAYDDVTFCIGYADEGFYFLDSKFIHERYLYFIRENPKLTNDEIIDISCENSYSSLFQLGIIKPYGESNEPLYKVRFKNGPDKPDLYKKCFCISSELVDFDMDEMKIY